MVAEQEAMTRECIVRILEHERDLTVVGQVADGRQAVVMAKELKPRVALLDIDLPVMNGVETVRRMSQQSVPSVVICTTSSSSSSNNNNSSTVIQAGATAYLGQQCSPTDFLHAIRHAVVTPPLPARPRGTAIQWPAVHTSRFTIDRRAPFATLTPREREVLQLLAEGYVTKEISDLLQMSIKTVSTHRVHIKEKLDTHSIALLTKFAIREGLTHL